MEDAVYPVPGAAPPREWNAQVIVERSALNAILLKEPEGGRVIELLYDHPGAQISVGGFVEAGIVADRGGHPRTRHEFEGNDFTHANVRSALD